MAAPLFELFSATATRQPGAVAIRAGDEEWTYEACARQVEALAGSLRHALPDGGPVALNLAKSPTAIIAMLACLRAGLTYVPIDPQAPLARRAAVLADSGATAVVLDGPAAVAWAAEPHLLGDRVVLSPDPVTPTGPWHDLDTARTRPGATPPADVAPDDLAYILYTSGSTGDPKGVEITQANAEAFVRWGLHAFDIDPVDRVAVHAPLHFDLPVFDVFVGLAAGASLCLIDERTVRFPAALARFLAAHEVSVLYAVPTAYVGLVHQGDLAANPLPHLRLVLYAGEEFHPAALRELIDAVPRAQVWNLYGPVETNVVTAHRVVPADLDRPRIPIGRPLPHTQLVLVAPDGAVVRTAGDEGEIVVVGPSVSPGYRGDPDKTARSRLTVDVAGEPRTGYRTGDHGRWDDAGVLHFCGRRDGLVKTRGFRVEVGDVEAALTRHPDVAAAVVVPVPHPDHTQVLAAAVTARPGAELDAAGVVRWCRDQLPAYMVPTSVIVRAELPRTSTGKVDRVSVRAELAEPLAGVGSP